MDTERDTWFVIAGDDPNRVAGRLQIKRCNMCAALITVADEDEHIRWHISLIRGAQE